jgi:hypothetical protein
MANTVIYTTDYETTLQRRLAHPQNWKEVCSVLYTDTRTINTGYMSTVPAVQTVTRGTVFNPQDFALTAETLTISTGRDMPIYVDFADLAQTGYNSQMEIAETQGDLLNEFIETNVLAQHATWTNIGDSAGTIASGVTTVIVVSASNIDDIIRGVKRIIRVANGQNIMKRNGVFIIWRPADFELLEAFVQANGFQMADMALKGGTVEGFNYMGVDHYWSNDLAANHLFAGVKKAQRLGVLRSLYGKMYTQNFPAGSSGGILSGTLFYSRVDIGHLSPTTLIPLLYDVNVA